MKYIFLFLLILNITSSHANLIPISTVFNQQSEYEKAIKAGAEARNAGNFDEAIAQYKIALKNKPGDLYATEQMKICEDRKASREKEIDILTQKLLDAADESYKKAEYADALKLYERYQKLRPDNKSVAKKIKKCQQKLK